MERESKHWRPSERSGRPVPEAAALGTSAITDLLRAWSGGDGAARDALLPVVYAELRRQAGRAMRREGGSHTLQPTELVHEVFLRFVDQRRARWESRTQFFAVAAQLMRRILVDHARAKRAVKRAVKRGGGAGAITLDTAAIAAAGEGDAAGEIDVLALDDALDRLAALDPARARLWLRRELER